MEKSISSYNFPNIHIDIDKMNNNFQEIYDKISIKVHLEEYETQLKLNHKQYKVFSMILDCILISNGFFIDGSGETQKIFLYYILLAYFRSKILIVFAHMTSRVIIAIIQWDRTIHSRFKIPIDANKSYKYIIITIFIDKTPIVKQWVIKNVDKLSKDIMKNNEDFGGKVIIFCRDFRQILSIVSSATIYQTISTNLFLLKIRNSEKPSDTKCNIKNSKEIIIEYDNEENSILRFSRIIFPTLNKNAHSTHYMTNNILNSLTPNGLHYHKLVLKKTIIQQFFLRNLDQSNGMYNCTRMVLFSHNQLYIALST
ncbi:hypothetical protein Pfo_022864 [Paulownia fortunei]|nr:hypothetical protein Pfo_022864 [Paulownia fortunei]